MLQLAKESGINYKAYYKNTTIDPRGTKKHVIDNNVTIINPKESFFKLIQKKGLPSMFRRFCCSELKEYKILNVSAIGVRAAESTKRKKRYKTFEECRIYPNKEKVHQYYPLYNFTNKNIKDFIVDRKLTLAQCYYNEAGEIDFSRRLGCLGCPLKSDRGIADFKKNPIFFKAYLKSFKKYCETHPLKKFDSYLDAFYCQVMTRSFNEFETLKSENLFNFEFSAKERIENFFHIKIDF